MVTTTLPELLVNQGKSRTRSYRNLGMAVTDFSSTASEIDTSLPQKERRKLGFCNNYRAGWIIQKLAKLEFSWQANHNWGAWEANCIAHTNGKQQEQLQEILCNI